ncbi:ABC transporter permease [Clostridiaceae bacterium HSG29]|nr:ABC transporter permease [Clostridiaceae bacterium HSG29]
MRNYIIKRLLISVVILFFVTLILYTIFRNIPTSFVESIARERANLPGSKSYSEWLNQLNAVYGMDKGIFQGYLQWAQSAIQGNFGDSWKYNIPVIQKFRETIWYSAALGGITFVLQIIIAVPLGILAARKQYSKTDYAITVVALIGISLPVFFFATILKLVFAIKLGWFDLYGTVGRYYYQLDTFGKILDIGKHFVLPIIAIVLISIGGLMRYTRTNMLEVLNADYIRTARAKGLSEKRVINYHAFRNTLIPIVTIIGGSLPGLFAGSLITETLFGITGIGKTAYDAMVGGDIPFSMFYMSFLAVLTLLGTLIADILYAVVDPRVRIR